MTRKFTFLLMALLALAGFKSWGQETITIGNGTFTEGTVPFYNYYNYSYAQMLYLGSEIGQSGTITSISFDLSRATSLNGMKFDIYMKCVSKDSYSGVTDWVSVTDDDLVCTTTLNSIPSGWVTFTLDNPFVYDKTQGNLMIAFDNNTGSCTTSSGYAQFHYTSTSPKNTCLCYYQDGADIVPSNPSAEYKNVTSERPNIKIMLEPSTSCPKPTGLTASNITAEGATISWTGNDAESYDLAYGVASTFDLENPSTYAVQNTTATSVQLTGLTADTEYKCAVKAHCSDEEESAWSDAISFLPTDKIIVDFENGVPNGWTRIDADGDGYNWDIKTDYHHSGTKALCSESYRTALSPNNFFVSPQMTLGEGANVSFYAYNYSNSYKDHIGVGISTTGNGANDFVMIWDGTPANSWSKIELDLSDYAGESVYIAFRHYDCRDQYRIYIDDITIDLGETGTQYNITYDQTVQHGSISGPATAYSNQTVKVTATPDAGYALDHITVNGVDYEGTTFTMPENDATVSATFRQTVPFTVNDGTDHAQFEYMPFYGPYVHNSDTKSEIIYPASDLQSLRDQTIYNLTFYASVSNHDFGSDAWDVYVKEVNYSMPGQTGYAYTDDYASMTKVYSGPLSIIDHEMFIILDNPFVYNSQNLMICFQQTQHVSGTNANISWNGVVSGETMRSRGGFVGGNTGNASSAFLPKTTFAYIPSATYTVNLTQPEEGGSISAEPTTDVIAGTTITLSATPATGYEFGEWTVINSTTSQEITVTDNQFEMPESDVTVTATFEALVPHTVTIADGIQNGTVRLFDGDPTEYMAGETVSLEVLPAEGYFYPNKDEITVTDANGNNIDVTITDATNYSFIMPNSNVTVFAVFNLYYGVQVDTEIVGGSIDVTLDFEHSITGIPFFTEGTDVYFIPIPGDDYEYAEQSVEVYEWDLEQHEIGDPVAVDFISGYAHIAMPASDIFVTATFNRTKYNVTQQIVNPSESGYFYIENAEHILVGTSVVISDIAPSLDYQFVSVTVTRNDNQATVETYKYNDDYVFTMPNSDVTVTVNFEAIPYYDVTINEPENGSAYINGDQSYRAGEEVVLTANPDEGYIISATDITITPAEGEPFHPTYVEYTGYVFNMPASDVTITAAFREIQTYTINYYVNGELEDTAPCKENEAIDTYTYRPYDVYGVNFEGWGVAPIGTYVTEKPTIIGEEEYPTHNYDLHAVFSYSETLPAAKGGEIWKKVTSTSDLKANDKIVLVYNSKIMCQRWDETYTNYEQTAVSVVGNEINSLPENAIEFTLVNESDNWKLKYTDWGNDATLSYTSSYQSLVPQGLYGASYDNWIAVQKGSAVIMKNANYDVYIAYSNGQDMIYPLSSNLTACEVFKLDNPMITTNYYMTSVLTNGEVTENTTAKNIIITNLTSINVKDGATLTMDANGLFRNENEYISFMFEDGAQFYYTGEETIKAIFEKEIAAYEDENSRDGYYLIANPTDNTVVLFLDDYDYDLYTFDPTQALEWQNERVTEGTPVVTRGTGYLYACAVNNALRFTGNLIPAGTTNKSLTYAAAGAGIDFPGFNLIGNPYACNAYVEGYNFYRMVDGELQTAVTSATIAPCEGFFVEATAANQSVSLSTTAPEAPASLLNITVSQNRGNVIDRAIVNFNDNNDLHKFMMNPQHTNLSIAKGGETFAAISTEAEGELPVNFKAEKDGTYTITVNTENVEANYLHLIDNLTGMDTDLLSTPSYTFNATTSDYASRFKLVFSMNNNEDMSQANSFAYINNGEIIISNEGRATLQVIDVMGRIISSEEINGECRISTNGLTAGLYILNLNGMTQKIVVK